MPKLRQISIACQTNLLPSEYIEFAQVANRYDFDVVSVYSDLPYHPAYGPLVLMAPHLQRARVGPAGVTPARLAPIDMAAQAALLHSCAPAGSYLGLVRGAWNEEFGIPPLPRPLTALPECARIVRQLWRGEAIDPVPQIFPVPKKARLAVPLPQAEIPILVGTWGPKLARRACDFAAEVKVGGSANPTLAAHMADILRAGETHYQRNPSAVKLVLGCVTVVDQDHSQARAFARQCVARYLSVVYPLDATIDCDPEWFNRLLVCLQQDDLKRATELISDEILDAFALAGRPGEIIHRCEELYAAGVDRIEFGTPHGLSRNSGISLLGKEVLPSLQ